MLNRMKLFAPCLLNLVVVRSVVLFTFGNAVFLECFPDLQCSPLGFTKNGQPIALRLKRKFCVSVVAVCCSSVCDREVRCTRRSKLKSRSCISTETSLQSKRSSTLSHRIWGLDCHLDCFWRVVFNYLSSVVWNHIWTYHLTDLPRWLTEPPVFRCKMCLVPAYVKQACKSPVFSFLPPMSCQLHFFPFIFSNKFLSSSHISLQKWTVKH